MNRIKTKIWLLAALFGTLTVFGQDGDAEIPPKGGMGQVKIVTTPEKAVAYMGGVKLGSTPIDTAFSSGRYTLTIMLNGEELVRERVNIWAGKTTSIEKNLALPYGTLTIRPNPVAKNYAVFVDGEQVGQTKGGVLTINRLEAGTRVVKLSGGGRSKEYNVDIIAEQTVELSADFKAK